MKLFVVGFEEDIHGIFDTLEKAENLVASREVDLNYFEEYPNKEGYISRGYIGTGYYINEYRLNEVVW